MAYTASTTARGTRQARRKKTPFTSFLFKTAATVAFGYIGVSSFNNYLETQARKTAPAAPLKSTAQRATAPLPPAKPQAKAAAPAATPVASEGESFNIPGLTLAKIPGHCYQSADTNLVAKCQKTADAIINGFDLWHEAAEKLWGDVDGLGKGIFSNPDMILRVAGMESDMGRKQQGMVRLKDGRVVPASYQGTFQHKRAFNNEKDRDSFYDYMDQKLAVLNAVKDKIPALARFKTITEETLKRDDVFYDDTVMAMVTMTGLYQNYKFIARVYPNFDNFPAKLQAHLLYFGHNLPMAQKVMITQLNCTQGFYALTPQTAQMQVFLKSNPIFYGPNGEYTPVSGILNYDRFTHGYPVNYLGSTESPAGMLRFIAAEMKKPSTCLFGTPLVARNSAPKQQPTKVKPTNISQLIASDQDATRPTAKQRQGTTARPT